jgi:hypothetical protein
MAGHEQELLPLEDATSWEEFQERWVIERARRKRNALDRLRDQ